MLLDTTLSAIVRDEIMNPAGGIYDFIETQVPFFEETRIIDTGSKDGTREALEELQAQYPNLKVLDRAFDDYASCRNYGLQDARTKWIFTLDADERLTRKNYEDINSAMLKYPNKIGFNIHTKWICQKPEDDMVSIGINPRLFQLSDKVHYKNKGDNYLEFLYTGFGIVIMYHSLRVKHLNVFINHFCVDQNAARLKKHLWYEKIVSRGSGSSIAPSQVPESKLWKQFNKRRLEYI
ncbi:MAG: glycosyltransferase [Nanoarchaeota archaeon]|nr:glycosyltransferase [Nanoarchaeota archaeon]MBU1321406.1 glycosyltransferase [Nanoarchaeota archaeon]MBU1597824.1 glycosyltransferase [Nanoarchaeota archaeon]MBU2441928.1 glycosyltransferase [Nanoarchaeota archaeon]